MKELQKKYNLTKKQLNHLMKLEVKNPIDLEGLVTGLNRLGDYKQYGWSFVKASNMIAKLSSMTGRSPAIVGNGLKSIWFSVSNKYPEIPKYQTNLALACLKTYLSSK